MQEVLSGLTIANICFFEGYELFGFVPNPMSSFSFHSHGDPGVCSLHGLNRLLDTTPKISGTNGMWSVRWLSMQNFENFLLRLHIRNLLLKFSHTRRNCPQRSSLVDVHYVNISQLNFSIQRLPYPNVFGKIVVSTTIGSKCDVSTASDLEILSASSWIVVPFSYRYLYTIP